MKHKGLFWSIMGISILLGGALLAVGKAMGGELDHSTSRFVTNVGKNISEENMDLNLSEYANVKNLDFDLSVGDIKIVEGDDFAIFGSKVSSEISRDGETWTLQSPKRKWYHWISNRGGGSWEITLPKGRQFDHVNFSFGAADVEIEAVSADDLVIKVGAGEAEVKQMISRDSLDIKIGAGSFKVDAGEISNDSNIKCGAGEVNMVLDYLRGDVDVDCGLGEVSLTLPGTRAEYGIDSSAALGSVNIEDGSVPERTDVLAKLNLRCGMGEIDVDFNERSTGTDNE